MDGLIAMRNRVIGQGVQVYDSVSKPLWYRTTDPSQKSDKFCGPHPQSHLKSGWCSKLGICTVTGREKCVY
jgi:hypothetical protein